MIYGNIHRDYEEQVRYREVPTVNSDNFINAERV